MSISLRRTLSVGVFSGAQCRFNGFTPWLRRRVSTSLCLPPFPIRMSDSIACSSSSVGVVSRTSFVRLRTRAGAYSPLSPYPFSVGVLRVRATLSVRVSDPPRCLPLGIWEGVGLPVYTSGGLFITMIDPAYHLPFIPGTCSVANAPAYISGYGCGYLRCSGPFCFCFRGGSPAASRLRHCAIASCAGMISTDFHRGWPSRIVSQAFVVMAGYRFTNLAP